MRDRERLVNLTPAMVEAALDALEKSDPSADLIDHCLTSVSRGTGATGNEAAYAILVAACILFPDRDVYSELSTKITFVGQDAAKDVAWKMKQAVHRLEGIGPISRRDLAELGTSLVNDQLNPSLRIAVIPTHLTAQEQREEDVQNAVNKVTLWRRRGLEAVVATAAVLAFSAAAFSAAPLWVAFAAPVVAVGGVAAQRGLNGVGDKFGPNAIKALAPTRDRLTPTFDGFAAERARIAEAERQRSREALSPTRAPSRSRTRHSGDHVSHVTRHGDLVSRASSGRTPRGIDGRRQ